MAIDFNRYVDITSGVGGVGGVSERDLIGRLFTSNTLVPTNTSLDFLTADEVADYFGDDSEEYARALFYFSFISKVITKPRKISFARWAASAVAPTIYGKKKIFTLATFTSITTGAISITLGSTTNILTAIDFSGAVSLAGVAAVLQAKIRTQTGTMWTAATVTYNAVRGSFDLVGGTTGANVIATTLAGSGTEILDTVGWNANDGAILSNGVAAQSITSVLSDSAEDSNNFGSFLFIPALTIDQVTEAAEWNKIQNVRYIYSQRVLEVDASTYSAAIFDIGGAGLTLSEITDEYPDQAPMMLLAATDYSRRNAVQNYMYQRFTLTPSVSTNSVANTMDALRVNYYGRTQTAGQPVDFYQRGVLMGLDTDPVDMNVYANEIWLKDAAGVAIINLLLVLARVSANRAGRAQLMTTLQSVIDRALFNGTISVGKILNNEQKLFIGELTGDELAWHQVQNQGYWYDCEIQSYVAESGITEFKAVYTLIYSKDDAIRKVEGTHILI